MSFPERTDWLRHLIKGFSSKEDRSSKTVSSYALVAIVTGSALLIITIGAIAVICWRFPFCRSRIFWDHSIKRLLRKLYGKCKKEKKEDKVQLVSGPVLRRGSKAQPAFVVPQIFVDYGSRRTSCASEFDRRISLSSNSSRRTSLASDSDRRGSASSFCSRRTSLASDTDRRGSGSSFGSRKTSLASDTDRRGSNSSRSSRSSRRDSDNSKSEDLEITFGDFSDSELIDVDELYRSHGVDMMSEEREKDETQTQGKRSLSLAEIERTSLEGRPRPLQRRGTLSSLVVSSLNALDHGFTPANSQNLNKKKKVRHNIIGLPFDSPVVMHDLNLEDMMPRYAPPIKPTGYLKVQLHLNENKTELSIFVIEAQNLVVPASSQQPATNPFVKGFLVPGRTVKFRTKTVYKTKNPVFLEKFTIRDLAPGEIGDEVAIEFQVYSAENVTKRHLLGVCSILLKNVDDLQDGKVNLTLMPQTVFRLHQGDLRISGCYQPVAGKMVFTVLEAKQLPKISLIGTINPYVKVEMYVNGIREAKHKTKVRQNIQNPLWHHQCVFEINRENPKLLGHIFVFSVIHKDMMTGAHRIGKMELGWHSHGEQLDHWYEIMEHPHRPTDYWHPIIKESKFTS